MFYVPYQSKVRGRVFPNIYRNIHPFVELEHRKLEPQRDISMKSEKAGLSLKS